MQADWLENDSRERVLSNLVAQRLPVAEALGQLAVVHSGTPHLPVSVREGAVKAGGHVFPHPKHVPALTRLLLNQVAELWSECRSTLDDLHVAAFTLWGFLKIHPFPDGNGRIALDFAQLLLMHRWDISAPPLRLPDDAHRELGRVLVPVGETFDGTSAAGFVRIRDQISETVKKSKLATIRQTPALAAIAHWLRAQLVH